ncbi:hypothetical protein EC988_000747 [Linderina pennispora]|nr:hypothetical protein EC988_000747 [Linderina pennispora]
MLNIINQFSNSGLPQASTAAAAAPPSESLDQMQHRLYELQFQVDYLSEQNRRLSRHHNSTDSARTLDGDVPTDSLGDLDKPRFDFCKWFRTPGPKTEVLYRRHLKSVTEPITSPLFRLTKPARVADLLDTYQQHEAPMAEFMNNHRTVDVFQKYVLEDARRLPTEPQIADLHDQTTEHLPPLAAEEYRSHVSRLSYLMRSLHAIEIADPVFLNDPRTHLLLDLVFDLEQAFTLPRIDFLRCHASTIRAMNETSPVHHHSSRLRFGYAARDWDYSAVPMRPEFEHIRLRANAIPRYPDDLRLDSIAMTINSDLLPQPQPPPPLLGHHDSGLDSITEDCTGEICLVTEIISEDDETSSESSFDPSAAKDANPLAPLAEKRSMASDFPSKLHPVVSPESMEVGPPLHSDKQMHGLGLSSLSISQLIPRPLSHNQQPSPPGSSRTSGSRLRRTQ